jgi:TPR repeat protein
LDSQNSASATFPEFVVRLVLVALILSLGLNVPATADPLEDGAVAYNREDYASALRLWAPLAEEGDAEAQYSLGVLYHLGQGVPQDYAQAFGWYRKATAQGFAAAQYQLGNMYFAGTGVPQDYAAAMSWYRKAAAQQVPYAQRAIGFMYENGLGVPANYDEAMRWYSMAGESEGNIGATGRGPGKR